MSDHIIQKLSSMPPVSQELNSIPKGDKVIPPSEGGKEPRLTPQELKMRVQEMENISRHLNINLKFQIEDKTDTVIIKVMDGNSGEVIRQIPPEEIVALRIKLEDLSGMLLNKEA